jgi:hypothetical protein
MKTYPDCVFPLAQPKSDVPLVPCKKCSQSGTYIGYHPNGPVALDCPACEGKGWVPKGL